MHPILVLRKESKHLFDIKYSIYTHYLVSWMTAIIFPETACEMQLIKINLVQY